MSAQTASEAPRAIEWTPAAFRARESHSRLPDLQGQVAVEMEKRDRAVREAVDAGATVRQLANATGLTEQNIYRILGTAP